VAVALWRVALAAIVVTITVAVAGCLSSSGKNYDISPIFPLSDKCAKYHGDQSGEGIAASCMVTKSECAKAAADWRQAMSNGYVSDAIQFSCD